MALDKSGNKPLHEPMLTDLCRYMTSIGHIDLDYDFPAAHW